MCKQLRAFFMLSALFLGLTAACFTILGASLEECPVIKVENASSKWCSTQLTFTARVSGVAPGTKLTYKWTAVNGKITDGQGTDTIKVDADEKGDVSITVEVGGIDEHCQEAAGITIGCDKYEPPR